MVNTISSEVVKTYHPIVTEKDTLPQKSALTTAQTVAENEVIAEKEVSAADSTKLQYFQELKNHLYTLNTALDAATSRGEVSQDLILARQLAFNSVTNMLSSIDSLELTGEELSILEQTAQEMEKVLHQATQQKKVEVLSDTQTQETVKQIPDAASQKMTGAGVDTVAMPLAFEIPDIPMADVPPPIAKSDRDIASILSELLTKADEEYLQVYEYASKIRTEFQENIAEIQQLIPNHIFTETNDDSDYKGSIKVDAADIHLKLIEIIDLSEFSYETNFLDTLSKNYKYNSAMRKVSLYPIDYNISDTDPLPATPEGKAEAEYWASQLPGSKVEELKEGVLNSAGTAFTGEAKITGYIVIIDLEPLKEIDESLKLPLGHAPGGMFYYNGAYLSPTAFQTWQTGLNSQIETIKTSTQELSQSYNNANSIFTTLNKLLTSSIQTLFDSLAQYLRF